MSSYRSLVYTAPVGTWSFGPWGLLGGWRGWEALCLSRVRETWGRAEGGHRGGAAAELAAPVQILLQGGSCFIHCFPVWWEKQSLRLLSPWTFICEVSVGDVTFPKQWVSSPLSRDYSACFGHSWEHEIDNKGSVPRTLPVPSNQSTQRSLALGTYVFNHWCFSTYILNKASISVLKRMQTSLYFILERKRFVLCDGYICLLYLTWKRVEHYFFQKFWDWKVAFFPKSINEGK